MCPSTNKLWTKAPCYLFQHSHIYYSRASFSVCFFVQFFNLFCAAVVLMFFLWCLIDNTLNKINPEWEFWCMKEKKENTRKWEAPLSLCCFFLPSKCVRYVLYKSDQRIEYWRQKERIGIVNCMEKNEK